MKKKVVVTSGNYDQVDWQLEHADSFIHSFIHLFIHSSVIPGYGAEIPATEFCGQERKKNMVVTQEMIVKTIDSLSTPGIFNLSFFTIDAPNCRKRWKSWLWRHLDVPVPITVPAPACLCNDRFISPSLVCLSLSLIEQQLPQQKTSSLSYSSACRSFRLYLFYFIYPSVGQHQNILYTHMAAHRARDSDN